VRALVVYESMFGNTEAVARAIADGLSAQLPVDLVEVGVAPTELPEDVSLVVVGGPTHAFGMSRASTRQDAAKQAQGPLVSRGIGLREWLGTLRRSTGAAAAAFDTRVNKPRVPGSAARGAQKHVRRLGYTAAAPAESFFVTGTPGPLVEGEQERARRWGEQLGARRAAQEPERRA